jgi:hypothetical protein
MKEVEKMKNSKDTKEFRDKIFNILNFKYLAYL